MTAGPGSPLEPGSVWAERDISQSAIATGPYAQATVNIGISPEQLKAAIDAATDPLKQLNQEQQATITKLEGQLGATREQVLTFFRIIGETLRGILSACNGPCSSVVGVGRSG